MPMAVSVCAEKYTLNGEFIVIVIIYYFFLSLYHRRRPYAKKIERKRMEWRNKKHTPMKSAMLISLYIL